MSKFKSQSLGTQKAFALHVFFAFSILSPLVYLLMGGLINTGTSTWDHIVSTRLTDYLENTFLVTLLTVVFALSFSIGPAWLLSRYRIKGAFFLDILLVIPLTIPKYLMAYAYAGLFDFGGLVSSFSSRFLGLSFHLDILNPLGLSFVLACALFPYIYIAARLGFEAAQADFFEATKLLGRSTFVYFFRILFPLAFPSILAGMSFVIMESVGDYGASYYFGVDTLSTGIFRTWFGLNDLLTAFRLSLILTFGVVLVSILIFSYGKSHKLFIKNTQRTITKIQPISPLKHFYILWVCSLPIFLGVIFPVVQLIKWSYQSYDTFFEIHLFALTLSSVKIAGLTALVALFFALLLLYSARMSRPKVPAFIVELALYGYTLPGVVLAISILGLLFGSSKNLTHLGLDFSVFTQTISASLGLLILAGSIRFLAIAFRPLEAKDKEVGLQLDTAAHLLGASRLRRIFKIHLPLQYKVLISSGILVFIDMMKELPLTLLLKPYGVSTLATKAYEYASDEMIAKAAVPGLILILFGLGPIIWLRKISDEKTND